MSTYSEKLKDPRWQKMRLKVLEYANFRCQICGDSKSTLHVHHSYYTRGKDPWQYPQGSLICVCEYHHDCIHESEKPKQKQQLLEHKKPSEDEEIVSNEKAIKSFTDIFNMLERMGNE